MIYRFLLNNPLSGNIHLTGCFVISYRCTVTINVLWLFLTVQWVGLQCAIEVFPHTHLLFCIVILFLYYFYTIFYYFYTILILFFRSTPVNATRPVYYHQQQNLQTPENGMSWKKMNRPKTAAAVLTMTKE